MDPAGAQGCVDAAPDGGAVDDDDQPGHLHRQGEDQHNEDNPNRLGSSSSFPLARPLTPPGPRARTPHWDWETGAPSQHQRRTAGLSKFL